MGRSGGSRNRTGSAVIACAAVFVASMMLVSAVAASSTPEDPAVKNSRTSSDGKCLRCHSRQREKTLEDGDKLSLHVNQAEFAASVHGEIGCTGCHASIAGKKHPARAPIDSRRAYSLAQNESCRACHAVKFDQYEGSVHAALAAQGNVAAPVCVDCHSAHAVQSSAVYDPATGLPCKTCHVEVYEAYAQSVHGKARIEGNIVRAGHIQAPICADCHQAHEVTAVAASDQMQAVCLDCHENAAPAHEEWLPNSGLHLDVVSCAVCHSPLAERGIDLELFDRQAGAPVALQISDAEMAGKLSVIDTTGDGLDLAELEQLIEETRRDGQAVDFKLRGRMMIRSGAEAHQLRLKTAAVRNCESCHQYGSEAFRNVTVSVIGPDGRKQYYPAASDVLTSVASVTSVSDFYALGGTRIKLLDALLVLALLGGLAIPIGHLTVGRLLKKNRQ